MKMLKGSLKGLKTFFKRDEVLGQVAAAAPKAIVSLFMTELGNKAWATVAGLIGNIINEKWGKGKRKMFLRTMFTNLMLSFADPTPNQIRELKRNVSDLIAGVKARSFKSAFGSLIEEPPEVMAAIRSITPKFSKLKIGNFSLPSFKSKLAIARPIGSSPSIKQITPRIASRYGKVTESDIISY